MLIFVLNLFIIDIFEFFIILKVLNKAGYELGQFFSI